MRASSPNREDGLLALLDMSTSSMGGTASPLQREIFALAASTLDGGDELRRHGEANTYGLSSAEAREATETRASNRDRSCR